ncbi:uncharacterized protein PG986_003752 [Apiospora aurea]|uniref:F-box domain-containing protein n=1 Tax=Apiospora aurea TaxID=335848 RepID=A0ABR1QSJ9_9PEZI
MTKSKPRLTKAQRCEASRNKHAPKIKAAPPCAARDSVFATPELLGAILTFVSIRRLLVAGQRVCRLWKDVIDRSPQLQKHLHLQPEDDETEGGRWEDSLPPAAPNPVLRHAFQNLFFPGHGKCSLRFGIPDLRRLPIADTKNGRRRHNAFVRTGASWRSMLVSQPPPTELVLVAGGRSQTGGMSNSTALIRFRGPVTMGLLYDLVCHASLYDYEGSVVAWDVDPLQVLTWWMGRLPTVGWGPYPESAPPSYSRNIVIMGRYPRVFEQEQQQPSHPSQEPRAFLRRKMKKQMRDDGTKWMVLCEEYDAEAMERLIEEAEGDV